MHWSRRSDSSSCEANLFTQTTSDLFICQTEHRLTDMAKHASQNAEQNAEKVIHGKNAEDGTTLNHVVRSVAGFDLFLTLNTMAGCFTAHNKTFMIKQYHFNLNDWTQTVQTMAGSLSGLRQYRRCLFWFSDYAVWHACNAPGFVASIAPNKEWVSEDSAWPQWSRK